MLHAAVKMMAVVKIGTGIGRRPKGRGNVIRNKGDIDVSFFDDLVYLNPDNC